VPYGCGTVRDQTERERERERENPQIVTIKSRYS